jgi:hypothetical protein
MSRSFPGPLCRWRQAGAVSRAGWWHAAARVVENGMSTGRTWWHSAVRAIQRGANYKEALAETPNTVPDTLP